MNTFQLLLRSAGTQWVSRHNSSPTQRNFYIFFSIHVTLSPRCGAPGPPVFLPPCHSTCCEPGVAANDPETNGSLRKGHRGRSLAGGVGTEKAPSPGAPTSGKLSGSWAVEQLQPTFPNRIRSAGNRTLRMAQIAKAGSVGVKWPYRERQRGCFFMALLTLGWAHLSFVNFDTVV